MPRIIVGKPLLPNKGVELWYRRKLFALVDFMKKAALRELEAPYKELIGEAALDASVSSQMRIRLNKLVIELELKFGSMADDLAAAFVSRVEKQSGFGFRASLSFMLGGDEVLRKAGFLKAGSSMTQPMRETLKAAVAENVALIKSIPEQFVSGLQSKIYQSINQGGGVGTIAKFVQERFKVSKNRAFWLAFDQNNKASAAVNARRMDDAGITKWKWVHTAGSFKPRDYHRDVLNGQVFSMGEVPIADPKTRERARPGFLINCRCVAAPVIEV